LHGGGKVFGSRASATNMARASSRSAASHLHVVATDPATVPGDAPLIERALELEVLGGAVRCVAEGDGAVVVLDAPAGLGKTALLDHTALAAADAGCLVRRAEPGPLERHFPFGVVRALLEAPLREASDDERAQLLDGAAAMAGTLLLGGNVPSADSTMLVAHSVLWLCSALAERRPLALVIDDAQWADRSSLEVLAYLARRIDDLPLLIAVGARVDDPRAPSDLLSLLAGVRSAIVLHPQRLTPRGATQLIRRLAPETSTAVCRDCHRAVGGNPWLLGELGRQIATHGPDVIDRAGDDAPPVSAIARNVIRWRLATLAPRDRAVAGALAVLCDVTLPHVVAGVAGVVVGELAPARDALLAAGLLAPDGERLAHGLVAAAVLEDLTRTECERMHHEAARALMAAHAQTDLVACHLLQCRPQGDPDVSAVLVKAAETAALRAAPHSAAEYLERALREHAPGDDRGRMLAQLATVAFDAGLPDSQRRLLEALPEVHDRESRIDLLTRLAALNALGAGDADHAELFERELACESDPDARLAVEAASLDALMMIPERNLERARRVAAIDLRATTDPLLARVFLAHRAWLGVELGAPDAATCAALALEALEGDLLLREAGRRVAYHLCVRTLVMTDRAEEARRAIAAMRDEAAARGSLRLRAGASWYASNLALRSGQVAEAENHARLALDLGDEDVNTFTGGALMLLLYALIERGEFEEAGELLAEHPLDGGLPSTRWEIGLRHARARLWLAEGDFERAHDEAIAAGALREQQGRRNPSWTPWRSTAARALAHLGRRKEASALADAEVALAVRFGAPVPIAHALHARAVAEPGSAARVALCERGLGVLDGVAAVLQRVRLRLELGSALAQMGRRIEARAALRPALADADAVGAVLLAQRARRELAATGLRPRQAALEGVAALTPRQRQVCELAAAGKGNRAIAQELFLSVKTVETHLAAGYRKLGVNARADLAAQLAS
jgi:DNA-binding CsgD family transcriptional regulator